MPLPEIPALRIEQLRLVASCTDNVLVPFGNSTVPDKVFKASGPVYEELAKFLPGLAGESRSFDANGQWFKVLGTGGPETVSLGDGLFGTSLFLLEGVNPPPQRSRPPLQPGTACETQQPPDLSSNEAALEALIAGIEAAGYTPGEDIAIAMDPATSELFSDGVYDLAEEGRKLIQAL